MLKTMIKKVLLILFIFLILPKVTLVRGIAGDGWRPVYQCSDSNYILFESVGDYFKSPWENELYAMVHDTEGYCFNTASIGSIYDYDNWNYPAGQYAASNENIFTGESVESIMICETNTTTCLDGKNPSKYVKDDQPCCDPQKIYWYSNGLSCDKPELSDSDCRNSNHSDPQPYISTIISNTNYYLPADQYYICSMPSCLFEGGVVAGDDIRKGPYTEAEIISLGLLCYPETDLGDFSTSITPTPISINQTGYHNILNYYCLGGDVLTEAEFDNYRENLGPYLVCREYKDSDAVEYDRCLACINTCPTCIYSSLGCIDTTLNGVITTIMRMGIGVIGAVGILRIMQAAILRQSADPKDVQESWEIIMSVVLGTVVLLASSLILRVIGIDLLGILPFDF